MNVELILALGLISLVVGLAIVLAWPRRLSWPRFAVGLVAIVLGAGAILWRAMLIFAALALLVPVAAFAADDTIVPIGPTLGTALTIGEIVAGSLAAVGVAWLGYLAHRYLGIAIDTKMREALQSAIVNGLHRDVEILRARAAGATIDVGSPLLARVVNYILTYSPQAAAHFGLTEASLIPLVRAQLNRLMPPDGLAASRAAPAAPADIEAMIRGVIEKLVPSGGAALAPAT